MRILERLLAPIASLLKIPPLAVRMFRAAHEFSGLDRSTIPSELIPMNTIQLARGLLNFTVLQNLDDWVLPFWAVRQYDPRDPGFIPRSHLGLSMNLTHRNWTAVGSVDCSTEPVVDPHGLVTPFRNGWSIDVWLNLNGRTVFPSREADIRQELFDAMPVVVTSWKDEAIAFRWTAYVRRSTLVLEAALVNTSSQEIACEPAFAIRPFNPEGVSLVDDIGFSRGENAFVINGREKVIFSQIPARVLCSSYRGGDSAAVFAGTRPGTSSEHVSCPGGLANGFASFPLLLRPAEEKRLTVRVPLAGNADDFAEAAVVAAGWKEKLREGSTIVTPDGQFNAMLQASLGTLVMLVDGDVITPGPWTYHQFWFRDAAIMLHALDSFGFHGLTRPVVRRYPSMQDASGCFRSQQGEWDSTGQALWTVWRHVVTTHDAGPAMEMLGGLRAGVDWIRAKRLGRTKEGPHAWDGLLPAGLSAEHLGLADFYFWDNWWSVAGIQGFVRLCRMTGHRKEESAAQELLDEYRAVLARAITASWEENGRKGIPAGPRRGIDCGMIGSCASWYPLQELPGSDEKMRSTLTTLGDRWMVDGLFFQNFIHSGLNPYLTLQMAHAWLYAGERDRFHRMVCDVLRHATPTWNFPEAIHPHTRGGVMGDGHHGWAAAEFALAAHDAFVQEIWTPGEEAPTLRLLGGAPSSWFQPGTQCLLERLPVSGGTVSLETEARDSSVMLTVRFVPAGGVKPRHMVILLPFMSRSLRAENREDVQWRSDGRETIVECDVREGTLICDCGRM